jgi:hypothetical protein
MSNDHPHGTQKSDIKTVKKPPRGSEVVTPAQKPASGNAPHEEPTK